MKSIYEIIAQDEKVISVFTTHEEWNSSLHFKDDGTGFTGDWAIRKNPDVESIVIYHRYQSQNNIYKCHITSIEGPLSKYQGSKRYKIHFENYELLGSTKVSWSVFADCGANPVRYLNA